MGAEEGAVGPEGGVAGEEGGAAGAEEGVVGKGRGGICPAEETSPGRNPPEAAARPSAPPVASAGRKTERIIWRIWEKSTPGIGRSLRG